MSTDRTTKSTEHGAESCLQMFNMGIKSPTQYSVYVACEYMSVGVSEGKRKGREMADIRGGLSFCGLPIRSHYSGEN